MDELEKKAIEFGNDPKKLRARLRETRTLLTRETLRGFGKGTLDLDKKRLTGDNGVVLQWQVRSNPKEPIGLKNPQTSQGTVRLSVEKEF